MILVQKQLPGRLYWMVRLLVEREKEPSTMTFLHPPTLQFLLQEQLLSLNPSCQSPVQTQLLLELDDS